MPPPDRAALAREARWTPERRRLEAVAPGDVTQPSAAAANRTEFPGSLLRSVPYFHCPDHADGPVTCRRCHTPAYGRARGGGAHPGPTGCPLLLGAAPAEWPVFEPELRHHLRVPLEEAAAAVADRAGATTGCSSTSTPCPRFMRARPASSTSSRAASCPRWPPPGAGWPTRRSSCRSPGGARPPCRSGRGGRGPPDRRRRLAGRLAPDLLGERPGRVAGRGGQRVTKFMECWPQARAAEHRERHPGGAGRPRVVPPPGPICPSARPRATGPARSSST